MDKKTSAIALLMAILILGLYFNSPVSVIPDFDFNLQFNLKITSQTNQGT